MQALAPDYKKPNRSILPRGLVDTRASEHSVVLLWQGSWELAVGAEGDYWV